MGCDVEAFRATYFKGVAVPSARANGWALQSVLDDPVRPAIDLVVENERGQRVIVYVERKVEGARSLLTTRFLSLSYYKVDADVDDAAAAAVARGVGALLRQREMVLKPADAAAVFAATPTAGVPIGSNLELRINRDCNEDCLFCNTPPDSDSILAGRDTVLSELARQHELGYRRVTLTGREPTLEPHLEEYVRAAKSLGYVDVRLQTNGTTFSHAPALARLVDAGLDAVQVSLHTFRPETFARLVGKAHLLDKAVQGLRHVLAVPSLECEVLFVITRLNIGELDEFVATIARDFRSPQLRLTFSPVAPVGWGEQRVDLMPRLPELREALDRALSLCAEHGLVATIPHRCGLPLCATPPRFYACNMDFHMDRASTVEAGKAKGRRCGECAFDGRCAGVWSHYLAAYGDGDLVPVRASPG